MALSRGKKQAFTLIELLVSVAIFSGIVVLALGAFARSANSSIKSSSVRERTEAARGVVDRIGNDTQYIYTGEPFTAGATECGSSATPALGFNYSSDNSCLFMVLKYPDPQDNTDYPLVVKKYQINNQNSRDSMYLEETRGCRIASTAIECETSRSFGSDVIDGKYAIADGFGEPVFSGIKPVDASDETPLLVVNVSVKPTNYSGSCSDSPSSCYVVKSSFVPGG